MPRILTNEDVDAVAERILAKILQRIQTPAPATPPAPVPSPLAAVASKSTTEVSPKLAFNLKELSQELGISKVSIYRLEQRGLLKSLPYLRTKVYARSEVERFLKAGSRFIL